MQWKSVLERRVLHIHSEEKVRLEKQNRKYMHLKDKFIKLKEDHKALLGNKQKFSWDWCNFV